MTFHLTSDCFTDGDYLADRHLLSEGYGFGGTGGNVSPDLAWTGAPDAAGSFAITCFDPDAPTGSGFWHWVVIDLPATTTRLPEGAGSGAGLPSGARQIRTDFGSAGYGGPCPPVGDHPHRYRFTVHAVALDRLPVADDVTAAVVGFQLSAHTLATATLMGLCRRPAGA
jgi:Raf kinase inhibitor-like YbhB/YbcL family protein